MTQLRRGAVAGVMALGLGFGLSGCSGEPDPNTQGKMSGGTDQGKMGGAMDSDKGKMGGAMDSDKGKMGGAMDSDKGKMGTGKMDGAPK